MMDKNIVILEGQIGDDFKYGKSTNGNEYATFTLCVNSFAKEMADSTERTHSQMFIRVFAYDKTIVDRLKKIKVHRGQRANVFGRLVSFRNEYKGNSFISNNVICRDLSIIKTKA